MAFLDHLRELRKRLIVSSLAAACGAIVAFLFYDTIIGILVRPFEELDVATESLLFVNTIFEGFVIKLKVALLSGVILSLPVHLYNAAAFVLPGLTPKERRIIITSLLVGFVLLAGSVYYGYFKVIPLSLRFLTGAGFILGRVGLLLNFEKNVFYVLQFLLITVVVFQLPILLELLLIMNVLSRKALLRASRLVVVGIFVLAAVLTPPDFISQVSLALPLVALYFLTILVATIFGFGRER